MLTGLNCLGQPQSDLMGTWPVVAGARIAIRQRMIRTAIRKRTELTHRNDFQHLDCRNAVNFNIERARP